MKIEIRVEGKRITIEDEARTDEGQRYAKAEIPLSHFAATRD